MLAGPVAGTVLFAIARGVPMERITERTGLTSADLVELDARLPERHMPTLWRLLAETFPGEAVALEMARSVPLSFFGLLLHSTRYAADLRAALQMLMRYSSVMSSRWQVSLVPAGPETRLEYYHPLDEEDGGHASELAVGLGVRYVCELLGVAGALCRVELGHSPFGPPKAYADFFGVPVRFETGGAALVYHTDALDRPLPAHDLPTLRFVEAHLELVRERELARGINSELIPVREAILHNAEAGEYGVEALARRLATTPRSLQRLVAAQGTNLRTLIDEVREANARELLGDSRLSVGEVGFLLGYSAETSFRRAFKRWTGRSPTQARGRP